MALTPTILAPSGTCTAAIKADERVTIFDTYGHLDAKTGDWIIPFHGWIYEPEMDSKVRAVALELVCRLLGIGKEKAQSDLFKKRARMFMVDNERGKRISIRLGRNTCTSGASEPNGHFEGMIRLSSGEAQQLLNAQSAADGKLRLQAETQKGDKRVFAGAARLIGETGLSVISDIDDTIKVTNGRNYEEYIANTFCRDYQPVRGMAEVYQHWQQAGACFHYVSVAPWQLYEAFTEFLQTYGFPRGTLHLQRFRWKDTSLVDLFIHQDDLKRNAIEPIMRTFPRRKFIFVGDSIQKDPEVYGEMARKYPQQVQRVYIVNATGEDAKSERFRRAFNGVSEERWRIVRQAEEIKEFEQVRDEQR